MRDIDRSTGTPLTDEAAATEARRILSTLYHPETAEPPPAASYRDDSPVPAVGDTPPVHQPDSRAVPSWATGIAVASIGIGAGCTGVGCLAWLVLNGLSSVTLNGVLLVFSPFAGLAVVVAAVGAAVANAKRATTHNHNHFTGPVTQHTELTAHARGMFARATTDLDR